MRQFFKWLFSQPNPPKSRNQPRRLMLEAFESRDLLSASAFFSMAHRPPMDSHAQFRGGDLQQLAGFDSGGQGCQGSSQSSTLTTALTGANGASGAVTFTSNGSSSDNTLTVSVTGLTASSTYTVMSGTTTLGTITTDANGQGKLSVSDLSPALVAGAAITVTDSSSATVLTGTLANAKTTLTAALTGATGTSGSVTFKSDSVTGDNSLSVKVSGLKASSTYTVVSGTTTLGSLTTDASGTGTLSVSDLSPALAAGAVITVLDADAATVLSGTLATATNQANSLFNASLTGTTGTSGNARSHSTTSAGSSLRVEVSGLTADTTYTVQVDGTTVGQIVTNAGGHGKLSLDSLAASISAGSVITVQDSSGATVLQGTFAAAERLHGRRRHG